ncbi:uncharacterized protein UTRI_01190_B [Ustilago trichophora]|uniref:AAR2 protein n=1 Tax=Ustilago trichophora TaxID=86804 RepID=A0A5C3DWH8_9BASI|nr:uncharacterized protein UTRI_01190_B [Ustilago trichophora]
MTNREVPQSSCMLLLNGLPSHTQISLDGHSEAYLTNDQFTGIKSLPPGWHCVSWSIASGDSSGGDAMGPSEGSIRNVLLRWFEEGEVAIRELDRIQQRLVNPDHDQAANGRIGRFARRQFTRTLDPSSSNRTESTIVTPDVLGSVEPRLLPYPNTAWTAWRNATRNLSCQDGKVGRKIVAKVLGVDGSSGDSVTDSLATGPSRARHIQEQASIQLAAHTGREEGGKVIWGKSRPKTDHQEPPLEPFEVEVDGDPPCNTDTAEVKKRKRPLHPNNKDEAESSEDETLQFTPFDTRRSWPPASLGAELTRWSQDKSWLLRDVAFRSRSGISPSTEMESFLPLLCEFELAFVLFIGAQNGYAWEQWKDLLTLFCRSWSIIGAQSTFQLHPSTLTDAAAAAAAAEATAVTAVTAVTAMTGEDVRLDGHVAFLTTLWGQFGLLDAEFWSQTNASEEKNVLKELDVLRANIARSLSSTALVTQQLNANLEQQQQQLVTAWRKLSHLTSDKFGWNLDRRLDEEAEIQDDAEAEEGEDAPIVVEL